jgi:hypothetical protein
MIHIPDRQIKLVFMELGVATILGAAIGEHTTQLHLVGIKEG